jgi:hypothetical protein
MKYDKLFSMIFGSLFNDTSRKKNLNKMLIDIKCLLLDKEISNMTCNYKYDKNLHFGIITISNNISIQSGFISNKLIKPNLPSDIQDYDENTVILIISDSSIQSSSDSDSDSDSD